MQEKRRLEFIDIARGMAMICIILGHLESDSINRVIYTFHVPIFFLIAGFFIDNRKSIKEFTLKRMRSLLVPYAAACAVMLVIGTLETIVLTVAEYGPEHWFNAIIYGGGTWLWAAVYGAGNSFELLYYVPGIGAIWFLWAVFWGGLLLRISLNMNKWIRPVFFAALFAAAVISKNYIWLPFSLQPGMCAGAFMYIGWLSRQAVPYVSRIHKAWKIIAVIIAAAAWGTFIYDFDTFWFVRCGFGRGAIDIMRSLCACGIVMLIARIIELKLKKIGSWFAVLGKYSTLLLCIHNIELNFFPWKMAAGYLVGFGLPEWAQLPLIIAAKLAADLFMTWLLSKVAFIRKIFGYTMLKTEKN